MRRLLIALTLLALPSLAFAQAQPAQLTNDDLLRILGMKEIQVAQCGKALEAAQQEIARLTPKPETPTRERK